MNWNDDFLKKLAADPPTKGEKKLADLMADLITDHVNEPSLIRKIFDPDYVPSPPEDNTEENG